MARFILACLGALLVTLTIYILSGGLNEQKIDVAIIKTFVFIGCCALFSGIFFNFFVSSAVFYAFWGSIAAFILTQCSALAVYICAPFAVLGSFVLIYLASRDLNLNIFWAGLIFVAQNILIWSGMFLIPRLSQFDFISNYQFWGFFIHILLKWPV